MSAATAQAADLGGNCCADLEERVAELEATAARKGNRKVKLAVYGQVNQALMYWDDGFEENVYAVTNDNARTRFGFKGDAKIADDWKAGFTIEIGIRTANSKRSSQNDPTGNAASDTDIGLDLRHAYWFLESKSLGRVSVGVTGSAAEGVTEINLAATKDIAKYSDVEDSGLGMFLRGPNGALSAYSWRRILGDFGDQPGEGDRRNEVKYDSPTIAGFTFTAAWGTDDFWDVGLRYSGEIGDFKIAAGIAYGETTDGGDSSAINFGCPSQFGDDGVFAAPSSDVSCNQVGGSISVMHEPSGIYVNFAAGELQDDTILNTNLFAGSGADDSSTFFSVEGGIEKKWIPLGKTTVFGQYYDYDGGANARRGIGAGDTINTLGVAARIFDQDLEMYGVGIVQGIDAAAMHLYTFYRHYEGEITLMQTGNPGNKGKANFEDLDILMSGAIIKF